MEGFSLFAKKHFRFPVQKCQRSLPIYTIVQITERISIHSEVHLRRHSCSKIQYVSNSSAKFNRDSCNSLLKKSQLIKQITAKNKYTKIKVEETHTTKNLFISFDCKLTLNKILSADERLKLGARMDII